MPKAGRYDYPAITLDDAIEKLAKARRKTPGRVVSRSVFIDAMGMAETGGHTHTIVSALEMYGLIETGSNEIRVTELGEVMVYGKPEEIHNAKSQAVRRIELYNDLITQYGTLVSDDQLQTFLLARAAVERAKVQPLEEKIGKLFKKDSLYIKPTETSQTSSEGTSTRGLSLDVGVSRGESKINTISAANSAAYIEIRQADGQAYVFPLDNIDLAKSIVNTVLDDIKRRQASTQKET